MQLVLGAAPAPAGGTTGVKLVGEGEEAVAAKPKFSAPWVQERTGSGLKGLVASQDSVTAASTPRRLPSAIAEAESSCSNRSQRRVAASAN